MSTRLLLAAQTYYGICANLAIIVQTGIPRLRQGSVASLGTISHADTPPAQLLTGGFTVHVWAQALRHLLDAAGASDVKL
jgi:hypothetical protein